MLFAVAKVKQDELTVARERREPIPNVTVRGGVGYNFETRNNTADVAFAVPVPLFDRNQGTVRQAGVLFRRQRNGQAGPRVLAFGQRQTLPWQTESFLLMDMPVSTDRGDNTG